MKLPSLKRSSASADDRIPRGAIIVVVVGLIATLAAALLSNSGAGGGEAAHLEFVQKKRIADSEKVAVPGSKTAKMQLVDGSIKETGTNVAGYSLFRVLSTVKIDKGARIGGELLCSIHAPRTGTLIAQSSGGLRMLYPRSSEKGIYGLEPEPVIARFASHGVLLALLEEVTEDMPEKFTTIQGVKVGWPEYQEGTEHILYYLPHGKAKTTVELPFYTIWKSRKAPAAQISCTLETKAGKATVETEGSLNHVSPAIDEEAEELKQEERAEAEEAEGGGEGE
ncbi:MAG: hypothetical protein JST08_05845 [Actinobacteria bacterium]|nr:hypothetical protein [Actinomycetota bacterium]